jgi:hypothetical protein
MLTSSTPITTLVFDDGDGPGVTLPPDKVPENVNDETTCVNSNEFPDERDPSATRRAAQIIVNLEGWDKPSFENSLAVQAKAYKALAADIESHGDGAVCMRIFNTDNSVHGAGVKFRVWFKDQAACIAYTSYLYSIRFGPTVLGTSSPPQTRGSNTFPDYEDSYRGVTPTYGYGKWSETDFGPVTLRMVTNPQSKCHKWKTPAQSVCSQQLEYFTPGTPTKPTTLVGGPSSACPDDLNTTDINTGSSSGTMIQIIFSLGAKTKAAYRNDPTFMKHVVLAFKRYFGAENPRLQVKNLDNSAAGVGLHMRLYYNSNDKSTCTTFATNNWSQGLPTDAATLAAENFLYDNIFKPYEDNTAGVPSGYFGTVTRRATMQQCKDMKLSTQPNPTNNILPGDVGFIDDVNSVS